MLDNFRVRLAGLAPVALRAALAATFIAHGWLNMQTLLDGGNPVAFLADRLPHAQLLGWLVGVTEFAGGLCILLGLLTRFWSAGLVVLMGMAIRMVHFPEGFKMHAVLADGQPKGAGYEWPLVLGLTALGLFLLGPGPLSLDYLLGRRLRKDRANSIVGCGMRYPARETPEASGIGLGQPVYQPPDQPQNA